MPGVISVDCIKRVFCSGARAQEPGLKAPGGSAALLQGPAKHCTESPVEAPVQPQGLVSDSLAQVGTHKTWDA